jgi:hypothetical protein
MSELSSPPITLAVLGQTNHFHQVQLGLRRRREMLLTPSLGQTD